MIASDEIGAKVKEFAEATYGSQSEAARAWGLSPAYVSLVVLGNKRPSNKILMHMGLVRVVTYKEAA